MTCDSCGGKPVVEVPLELLERLSKAWRPGPSGPHLGQTIEAVLALLPEYEPSGDEIDAYLVVCAESGRGWRNFDDAIDDLRRLRAAGFRWSPPKAAPNPPPSDLVRAVRIAVSTPTGLSESIHRLLTEALDRCRLDSTQETA